MEWVLIFTMWIGSTDVSSIKYYPNADCCYIAADILNSDLNKDPRIKKYAKCFQVK